MEWPIGSAEAEVLAAVENDAERVYGDLSDFQITIELRFDGWHVDYNLRDPYLKGGGPHYVVDPATCEITYKRYEQ